jgi:sporulation protein YlmC with PRC-barrel domain
MWNAIFAGLLACALSAPAIARAAPGAPIAKEETQLYGLPIFTSDGVRVGAVAETGTDNGGRLVLLSELERPLGIGMQIVAIPLDLIVIHADRIDLFLTATEVRERLSKAAD